MIGRNPRNWESPDEIGRVDRYDLNAYSVSALPIASLRQKSADPGGGIPHKNFCGIPPNSSYRYGV